MAQTGEAGREGPGSENGSRGGRRRLAGPGSLCLWGVGHLSSQFLNQEGARHPGQESTSESPNWQGEQSGVPQKIPPPIPGPFAFSQPLLDPPGIGFCPARLPSLVPCG